MLLVTVFPDIVVVGVVDPTIIPLTKVKILPSMAVDRLVASPEMVNMLADVAAEIEVEVEMTLGLPVSTLVLLPDPLDEAPGVVADTDVGKVDPMTMPSEIV